MGSKAPFPAIGDWPVLTLLEACTAAGGGVQTGPFGSQLHNSDYVADGIPSIMPVNIGDNCIDLSDVAMVGAEDVERLARHRVQPGDILYSRRGDIRRRALIREDQAGWLCGTGCLRVRPGVGTLDSAYLSHYLGHPRVQDWIGRHAIGATMPNLSTGILAALPVVVPPLDEQRRIASVLGSLDDKIELNRRMSRTLDEIAQGVFKSWFEDPGRRCAETGSGADWRFEPLGAVVTVVGGTTPSTARAENWEDGVHAFCTPKDMSRLAVPALLETERNVTDSGLASIGSGLLPSGTVLMSSRAPIGYVAVSMIPVCVNQGIIAMVCDGPVSAEYMTTWARLHQADILARANGSTFLEISKGDFKRIRILVPDAGSMSAFSAIAKPLHARMVVAERERQRLAQLRDLLLPRLLSGAIRVGDRPEVESAQ